MRSFLPTLSRLALLISVSCFAVAGAEAREIALSAANSTPAGGTLAVTWRGETEPRDFVSIDELDMAEKQYGKYIYVGEAPGGDVPVPQRPGLYEVRYHSGESGYAVLASARIEVTSVTATLTAPERVTVGSVVEITWEGPGRAREYVSITEPSEPDTGYGRYAYVKAGTTRGTVEVTAPSEPGTYEVRYHLAGNLLIARRPLVVTDANATVDAPAQVDAGSSFQVTVTGSTNPRNYVSIDELGAPDSEYGHYAYVTEEEPLTLTAPDAPGDYLIRLHLDRDRRVIAESPLRVGATTATVRAPESTPARGDFEVEWTGPNNARDFIAVVDPDSSRTYETYAYTRRGSTVLLRAPETPGEYEVRYLTGQDETVLASAPLRVTPSRAVGQLRVVPAAVDPDGSGTESPQPGAVALVLDASGSMLQRLDGTRRIDLAKTALVSLVEGVVPAGTPFALRVFGHRQADACRTDLEIHLAPLDRSAAVATIRSIEAKNLAKTPIAASLERVAEDLARAAPPHLVVLLTDGEETCDGDPAAAVRALRARGVDVRINVVGFAIDEPMLAREFESWARLGGGAYFDAADGTSLENAVAEALRPLYEVLRDGEVIATGAIGGEALTLPVGSYRLRRVGTTASVETSVDADREQTVRLD